MTETIKNLLFIGALVWLVFFAGLVVCGAQSPLDQWYEQESIMNRDQPGNRYYNGPATTAEYDFADFVNGNQGGECQACFTPNPPPFCFEPGHHCHQASMPIDGGIIFLIVAGVGLAAYAFRTNLSLK